MSKVIELDKYRKDKHRQKYKNVILRGPVWFYELNDGIKQLALKDMELIIHNVQENLMEGYQKALKLQHFNELNYSLDQYIVDSLNVNIPFSIVHGIQLSRGYHLRVISENDWNNITDIIIRICMITHYQLWSEDAEPLFFVDQYSWDSIQIDVPN